MYNILLRYPVRIKKICYALWILLKAKYIIKGNKYFVVHNILNV